MTIVPAHFAGTTACRVEESTIGDSEDDDRNFSFDSSINYGYDCIAKPEDDDRASTYIQYCGLGDGLRCNSRLLLTCSQESEYQVVRSDG